MSVTAAITGSIISIIFLLSGVSKLTKQKMALENQEKFQIPNRLFTLIGAAEILGAIGVLTSAYQGTGPWDWAGFFASMGLIVLMIGAIQHHFKIKDKAVAFIPAVALLILCGIYLIAVANR